MTRRILAISSDALDGTHQRIVQSHLPAGWEGVALDDSELAYANAMTAADVVVGWPPPQLLQRGARVKLVQLPSAGYEEYADVEIADAVVCNAAGVLAPAVAEHCLALMFAFARRLPEHVTDTAAHRWRRLPSYRELAGSTTCIIGLGDIGREVATRCKALGMTVSCVMRDSQQAVEAVDSVFNFTCIASALAAADFVVACLPGGDSTRGLIDTDALSALKPGSFLISVGRGSTLDQEALLDALRAGRLAGAGIDVWDPEPLDAASPLWQYPNVVVTSHSAGLSNATQGRLAALVADNVDRFSRRLSLRNQVLPTLLSRVAR